MSGGIICQECFNFEATMQVDDGEYLCFDCYQHKDDKCCKNCKYDGMQIVERKCLTCTINPDNMFVNFEAKT